jgi:hypothetical protein
MGRMRQAYRDIFGDIHWRALAAVSVVSLLVIGVLSAADAPVVITSIVVGGAAASVALSMVGGAFNAARSTLRSQASEAPTVPPSETL